MDLSARRLIAYWQGADCADDLRRLTDRDPEQAKNRRRGTARRLDENLAALGAMPSELDRVAHARSKAICQTEFFALIRFYSQSITAR